MGCLREREGGWAVANVFYTSGSSFKSAIFLLTTFVLVNFKVKSFLNKVYSFVCTLGIEFEINERLSRGRVNWNVPSMTKVGSAL